MRTSTIWLAGALALSLAAAAMGWGYPTVADIVDGNGLSMEETKEVYLHRKKSAKPEGMLKRGTELEEGDQLISQTGRVVLTLAANENNTVLFHGQFKIVVMPPRADKSCFLDLTAGEAHVMGDASTSLGVNDKVLGPEGTHYSVTVLDPETESFELKVFDGKVRVDLPNAPNEPVLAETQETRTFRGQSVVNPGKIDPRQIKAEAALFATVDASRQPAERADPRSTVRTNLSSTYERVINNPGNAEVRLSLVVELLNLKIASPWSMYHVDHAIAASRERPELWARARLLRVAVIVGAGEPEKAEAEYRQLQDQFEPEVLDQAQAALELNLSSEILAALPRNTRGA